MKKFYLFALLAMVFAAAGCTKSDPATEPVRTTNPEGAAMHFYGVALPEATRGAAQHDRLWHNGTTVKVKFLNGNTTMQDKVEEYAKEWEKYANITFKFVENEDAHVRVGFDWNANRWVTWSYIGTDCKVERNQAEATMSFADFDYKSEDEIRGDVLRAFGQALGLELESRNINFAPQWSSNVNRVKSYWELDIEDVTWDVIKQYVFDPLDSDNAISTDEYDALSIMRWPFPGNILLNGGPSAGTANIELSELDKVFIAELYPKGDEEKDYLAKMVIDVPHYDNLSIGLGLDRDNAVFIDWGNGNVSNQNHISSNGYYYNYNIYDSPGKYTITIYGDTEALVAISMSIPAGSYCKYESLDVSECTHLRDLSIRNNNLLSTLDVSNCPLLESLSFSGTLIETIDLSNNPLLVELWCNSNQLTSLDFSNNPMLNYVACENNPFMSDQAAVVALANSLPDRTGLTSGGVLNIGSGWNWISTICTAKNWRN